MRLAAFLTAFAFLSAGAAAQEQTLADIRRELSELHFEIVELQRELSSTGSAEITVSGDVLQRVDVIETELRRLTAKTETLEFRIFRIVRDGTNRVGDLEFRLCELEADCDISSLGRTPMLGGDFTATDPGVSEDADKETQLAVGEQADFDRAKTALDDGEFRAAAGLFQEFSETYFSSPLAGEVHFLRGEALSGSGETSAAARAFLESFSGDPDGRRAPDALFRLGESLAKLGQTSEACVTFSQVGVRFPDSQHVMAADAERRRLDCS